MNDIINNIINDIQFTDIMMEGLMQDYILEEGTLRDSNKVMYRGKTSKEMVKEFKNANKLLKKDQKAEAKKGFERTIVLAKQLKKEIDEIKEPTNYKEKRKDDIENGVGTLLHTIIMFIPFVQFIEIIDMINITSKPHAMMQDTTGHVTVDELSKKTGNEYKRQCQVALNNFINKCNEMIRLCK